jgi:transposase
MPDMPAAAAKMIAGLAGQILDLQVRLREIEGELLAWQRSNETRQTVGDDSWCRHCLCHGSRRAGHRPAPVPFRPAVCCLARGFTPLQHSSGGKDRLGRISKMGDKYLCGLLVVGMTSRSARKVQAECRRFPARPSAVAKAGSCGHGRLGAASV